MPLNQEDLSRFKIQRERLGALFSKASGVIQELNMTEACKNLEKLGNKVHNDSFKIQVVGTFKNGKSTFINALLGEQVLPAYALPCTAVINEIKYGEKKKAVLYFREDLPAQLPTTLSSKALAHMKAHGMKNIPPMEIDYKEIEEYVVIPMGEDPTEMLLESPYEKCEVFWPLETLKEGVEIIDSPGLNEHQTRTRVTLDYVSKADAIIFVLDATKLCSEDEMEFIENEIYEAGYTDAFFLVNRFDLIPEYERERVKQFAKMKLEKYTTNSIFFISAQNALDGQMHKNIASFENSGLPAFASRLTDFLTKDKGRIKLSQPARELKRILNNEASQKVIPVQKNMLEHSIDDVRAKYEVVKPELDLLKSKKDQMIQKINNRINISRTDLVSMSTSNYLNIATMIPVWVDSFEPKTKFIVVPTKSRAEKVVKEITDFVTKKLEEQQRDWKSSVFVPCIEQKCQYIFESAEQDLSKLYAEIDSINMRISGNQSVNPETVPLWERIAGAAGGILIGDLGLAFSGGMNGFSKDLAKTAAFEIGAGAILYLLGALNPFTIVAVLLASIINSYKSGSANAMKKTKSLVSDRIVDEITKGSVEQSNTLADAICQKMNEITASISTAIDTEINQTEEQLQSIILKMEQGKEAIEKRKIVLSDCEKQILEINSDLDTLTFELIEQH